jgi:hypothetical protein
MEDEKKHDVIIFLMSFINLEKNAAHPLCACAERVDQRSEVGVSRHRHAFTPRIGANIARISTHPVIASLDLPSLLRKEGEKRSEFSFQTGF